MFDYKYSDINGITPEELFNNPLLDFTSPVSLKTGELNSSYNRDREKRGLPPKTQFEAIYKHCKFIITNDKLINFSGSLHEYYNNGSNYNDFTFSDLINVITDLHQKFNVNPYLNPIHNIEFGVNVILPFKTKVFLNSIIAFKGKEYELSTYKGRGYLLRFSGEQYELKIYDKGFQRQLPENILRFEIKVTTMQFLTAKGIEIRNSADLLNPAIHQMLGSLLLSFFEQLVTYDNTIKLEGRKSKEFELLSGGQNPKYWSKLKSDNYENYKKRLAKFRELVKRDGEKNLQETVLKLIKTKWENLSKLDISSMQWLNDYLKEIEPKTFPFISDLSKTNFPVSYHLNSRLQTGNLTTENVRFCKVCGRDISKQKPGSVFCSELIFGRGAKRCRNIDSNPRNNFKNREIKLYAGGILFDVNPYLEFNFVLK